MGLTADNRDLVLRAREIIALRRREGYHEVGAALRTRTGDTFAAVHLEAHVGRVAVCAEAIALGMAAAAGDTEVEALVAPCGMCRELISDYAPSATVILPGQRGPEEVPVVELLPRKYRRQ